MYRYSIRNGSLERDWKEALEVAGRLGFDGVELTVKEEPELDRLLTDAGRDEVLGWTGASGAGASSLSISPYGPLTKKDLRGDAETRTKAVDLVRRSLRACKRLGGAGVLLPYFERQEMDITEQEAGWLAEDMKQCAELAEELQVDVCLETSFSSAQLKRVCDAVGSEHVGAYQDIANALHFGHDPVEMPRALGERVKMVHVKDTKGAMLGEGEVDIPGCREALREIGYEGWLVFETSPGDDAVASAEKNLAFAKKAFE